MGRTARWKGSTDVQEQPNSPIFENSREGPRYTRTFVGPYGTVTSTAPDRLVTMTGSPGNFFVDNVHIEKAPGGRGIMTVTLTPAPVQDYTFSNNSVLEVEFIELEKRLETHPMFNPVSAKSKHPNAGKYVLTGGFIVGAGVGGESDLDQIEEWKNQTTASDRKSKYDDLSDNATVFVDRLMRGQDSYRVYLPVIRLTEKSVGQPRNTRCGHEDDPPALAKVDGYSYMLTADRTTRERTWTRVREWTGVDEIDTEIYAG